MRARNNLIMKIEDKLVASVISGLKALYSQEVPEKMVQIQKTKKELNDEKRIIGKIDHTKNWKKNIANMFENLEIIKKND